MLLSVQPPTGIPTLRHLKDAQLKLENRTRVRPFASGTPAEPIVRATAAATPRTKSPSDPPRRRERDSQGGDENNPGEGVPRAPKAAKTTTAAGGEEQISFSDIHKGTNKGHSTDRRAVAESAVMRDIITNQSR